MALPFTLRAGFAVQSGLPDCALPKESIQRKGNPIPLESSLHTGIEKQDVRAKKQGF
jgi:hypothetical protein